MWRRPWVIVVLKLNLLPWEQIKKALDTIFQVLAKNK